MGLSDIFENLRPRQVRKASLFLAAAVFLLGGLTLYETPAQTWVAHGPIQTGHQEIACRTCHVKSTGTTRQQIQANIRYMTGLRETPVDFGYGPVTSDQCLGCHQRSNERHPIYRFNEPRFAEAVANLPANTCLGCHTEHENARSFMPLDGCKECHRDLVLKTDPLDVSHMDLIDNKQWQTCLGCHDFHGNHARKAQSLMGDAYPASVIEAYLRDGPSPYGDIKIFEGKTE